MRTVRTLCLVVMVTGFASPAAAQVVHSIGVGAGLFFPRGYDSRVDGDVLVANLTQPVIPGETVTSSLAFDIGDFRSYPIFGEWNVAIGKRLEVSAGFSYSNKRVKSEYAELVDSHGTATTSDDTPILQDLRLRMIPFTATVRFLPFGDPTSTQPYVGIGLAAVNYRYSETGQFVDLFDFAVFNARYTASGTAVGPVLLAGLRMPIGGDVYAFTLEGRYQIVNGPTGGAAAEFLGDRLDLSGGTVNFGFLVRF
jgi:hypothetical protein